MVAEFVDCTACVQLHSRWQVLITTGLVCQRCCLPPRRHVRERLPLNLTVRFAFYRYSLSLRLQHREGCRTTCAAQAPKPIARLQVLLRISWSFLSSPAMIRCGRQDTNHFAFAELRQRRSTDPSRWLKCRRSVNCGIEVCTIWSNLPRAADLGRKIGLVSR